MPTICYIGNGDYWCVLVYDEFLFTGTYQEVFFWRKYANQISYAFACDFAANV